jgi:hypothetical protein
MKACRWKAPPVILVRFSAHEDEFDALTVALGRERARRKLRLGEARAARWARRIEARKRFAAALRRAGLPVLEVVQ